MFIPTANSAASSLTLTPAAKPIRKFVCYWMSAASRSARLGCIDGQHERDAQGHAQGHAQGYAFARRFARRRAGPEHAAGSATRHAGAKPLVFRPAHAN